MGYFDPNRRDPWNNSVEEKPKGGGFFQSKLFIALLIALVGFFMYIRQVEVNPVTGEKQHVSMSPNQEVSLGLQSAPEMAREMGGELPITDPRSRVVKNVGELLVSKIGKDNIPWKFQFHLLNDPKTVNAFALPGGQIFITLGLYNDLKTEAELAGVLGHEIGHVIERHTSEQMAKNQLGQFLVMAVAAGASDYQNQNGRSSPAMVAAMVNQMFQLSYSRSDESEADIWGIKLLENAGFDPRSMIAVMKVLKAASRSSESGINDIFQTHPNPDLRIQQIEAYLKEHLPAEGLKQGRSLKELTNSYLLINPKR